MDIVYFSLNNWIPNVCYPYADPFKTWMETLEETLANEDWCKENKLCVYVGVVDQSLNFTISATKEWVEKNCPELLTEYVGMLKDYASRNMGAKHYSRMRQSMEAMLKLDNGKTAAHQLAEHFREVYRRRPSFMAEIRNF